ncbi:class I SAM-dependent methyltransferase [Sinosporangium siamense]|uniref:Methyltransferase n=1 Tax=Sinosporangium siamense TaxID=1367973 RepID=A0A919VA60_9ACTN|nr:class I SAM-dependent methyltransferase [Sinosporangium siamense]GII96108.1 methyltransferase [Sinosporangium siamense]
MPTSPHLQETRSAYDAVAALYTDFARDALDHLPFDRAMLAAFAELVRDAGTVADLGCGPGIVTAHLRTLGVTAFGIDLSPEMVAIARQDHPGLRFDVGSMTALDIPDGSLAGILAYYSVIHTPPALVPTILGEFHRTLTPGGHALLAFFADDQGSLEPRPFDHKVSLAYRWPPDLLSRLLHDAGLAETARLVREPAEGQRFLHGCLLVRKPLASA